MTDTAIPLDAASVGMDLSEDGNRLYVAQTNTGDAALFEPVDSGFAYHWGEGGPWPCPPLQLKP